jgi:hypothetical protein
MEAMHLNNAVRKQLKLYKGLIASLAILMLPCTSGATENKVFVQENISSAEISTVSNGYTIHIRLLASDIEEMFQNTMPERVGMDLMKAGAVEHQIGLMVLKRVSLKTTDGTECEKILKGSGEDSSNDELVSINIEFKCNEKLVYYSPKDLLAAHSPRSWQIVTYSESSNPVQKMLNSNSESIEILE